MLGEQRQIPYEPPRHENSTFVLRAIERVYVGSPWAHESAQHWIVLAHEKHVRRLGSSTAERRARRSVQASTSGDLPVTLKALFIKWLQNRITMEPYLMMGIDPRSIATLLPMRRSRHAEPSPCACATPDGASTTGCAAMSI